MTTKNARLGDYQPFFKDISDYDAEYAKRRPSALRQRGETCVSSFVSASIDFSGQSQSGDWPNIFFRVSGKWWIRMSLGRRELEESFSGKSKSFGFEKVESYGRSTGHQEPQRIKPKLENTRYSRVFVIEIKVTM